MRLVEPRYWKLPVLLYAYEMKRLSYWQSSIKTAQMDAFARYAAVATDIRSQEALNEAVLIAIGKRAQKEIDALLEEIDDNDELTAEEQEDIYNKFQAYQRIVFQVTDLLNDN